MAHRGPTGGLLLLQCFSSVADAQGISRCLNALQLSGPHPCFITVFSMILIVARADTLTSQENSMRAEQPTKFCKSRQKMSVKVDAS